MLCKYLLTSAFLEIGDGRNEDMMEEEWTAVHFDGPREQPSKVIDIPVELMLQKKSHAKSI